MLPLSLLSFCYLALTVNAAPYPITTNRTAVFNVASSGGNVSSTHQYGLMFEDINHSGDGGLYAELIMNRAFQAIDFSSATIYPWHSPSFSSLTVQNTSSLSSALPFSLNVATDLSVGGTVSFANPGYWGISVRPQQYQGSFYVRGAYNGTFNISLVSNEPFGMDVYASTNVAATSMTGQWTQYNYTLSPSKAANTTDNSLLIEFESALATDGSLNFNLLSLFPPTYKNRTNGMRPDLMQAWADLKPSFLRAPGGNNIEGTGPAEHSPRWIWNETIGPLTERPGHLAAWGYTLTDGMGLNEYFQLASDLGVDMVLSVFSGHYLDGTSLAPGELDPYIQSALDELEYLTGSENTTLGALRISHGYPNPWPVKFVEIGNEDNLSGGAATYTAYRYRDFHDAIKSVYPDITLIASTQYVPVDPGEISDYHLYDTPDGLVSAYNYFDANATDTATMIGEFAAVDYNSPSGANVDAWTIPNPFWQGSVAEAIFLLGAERNGNKIFGAAYAPAFANRNDEQWRTNCVYFDADPERTVRSTSYEMIALMSANRLTNTLPVNTTVPTGPLYWVFGDDQEGARVAKFAVYNSTLAYPGTNGSVPVAVAFKGVQAGTQANLTVLTAPSWNAFNDVGVDVVKTSSMELMAGEGGTYRFDLPDLSVAVLRTVGGGAVGTGLAAGNASGSVNGTASTPIRGLGAEGMLNSTASARKLVSESENGVIFVA